MILWIAIIMIHEFCLNLTFFCHIKAFNNTDTTLETIREWPKIAGTDIFKDKLKFQIKHSLFRNQIRDDKKSIFEVLKW